VSAAAAEVFAAAPVGELTFSCASSDLDIARAAAFRRRVFMDRRGVSFDEALEARRDRQGHVFVLAEAGAPVATARVLRHPSPLSPLATLALAPALAARGADSEVGRIAAIACPQAIRFSLVLLTLGSIWLTRNTGLSRYVAYCHPRLLDLYRAVGAEDTGLCVAVPGRDEPHRIICGAYADAARLGGQRLGVEP
jgi:hypothetical protein